MKGKNYLIVAAAILIIVICSLWLQGHIRTTSITFIVVFILIPFLIPFYYYDKIEKFIENRRRKTTASAKRKKDIRTFDENVRRLEKLGKLYKDGIISKEEFEEKKEEFRL